MEGEIGFLWATGAGKQARHGAQHLVCISVFRLSRLPPITVWEYFGNLACSLSSAKFSIRTCQRFMCCPAKWQHLQKEKSNSEIKT